MAQNIIVAEMVQSNKSNNLVWHVHVKDSDNPEHEGYCRSAVKAIHFAFLLKGRTNLYIDADTLERLMWHHRQDKAEAQDSEPATQSETAPAELPEPVHAAVPSDSSEDDTTQKKQRRTKRNIKKEAA